MWSLFSVTPGATQINLCLIADILVERISADDVQKIQYLELEFLSKRLAPEHDTPNLYLKLQYNIN